MNTAKEKFLLARDALDAVDERISQAIKALEAELAAERVGISFRIVSLDTHEIWWGKCDGRWCFHHRKDNVMTHLLSLPRDIRATFLKDFTLDKFFDLATAAYQRVLSERPVP